MMKRTPFNQEVANKLIEQLKKGTAPWQKPWKESYGSMMPINGTTGKPYKGVNVIHLLSEYIEKGYDDPRWMTYKQAESIGGQVKKGSKATTVQYWKFTEDKLEIDPKTGKKHKVRITLERPKVYYASVFNAGQINGLERYKKPELSWNPVKKAEAILSCSKANILHREGDRAFYSPTNDQITMPTKEQFDTPDRYYATALHELSHWTGHPSRLNRDTLSHPFGSEEYAKEELRAEIGSMMLGMNLGIGHDPGQHAAYVKSWIKVLEDNPREIYSASKDAEKIMSYILDLEKEQIKQKETTTEISTNPTQKKEYISVPYQEKDLAKQKGAKWDAKVKSWYVPEGKDIANFTKWTGSNNKSLSVEEEFKQSLNKAGLIVTGTPVMDGEFHRVPVEEGKQGSLDGAYKAYLDGVPAGFIQNHRTGLKQNWKAQGYSLGREEKNQLQNQANQKISQRNLDKKLEFEKIAKACQNVWDQLPDAKAEDQKYLKDKKVPSYGLKTNQRGELIVPVRSVDGNMMSFQKISSMGKSMEKGGQVKGGMHKIGDFSQAPQIAIAEGYATAASIHQATGIPVAVAFSCNNLEEVAKNIQRAHSKAKILICADNDRQTQNKIGVNPGVEAAKKAAKEVGGSISVPQFSSTESAKNLSDFNDLHCSRGIQAVKRQINFSLSKQKEASSINHRSDKDLEKNVAITHRERPRTPSKGVQR